MKKKSTWIIVFIAGLLLSGSAAFGQDDETALFTTLAPDALIVLDLSGSMNWTPAGQVMYTLDGGSCTSTTNAFYGESTTGYSNACTIDAYGTVPRYSNASCSGPFYRTNDNAGYTTNCSRLAIAKRALFDVMDDNDSGTINKDDETSLGVRLGYMRYYDCNDDDTAGDYSSGCNRNIFSLGTKYSKIYCNSTTSCSSSSSSSGTISGESASGGTPLASSLYEAKLYLDAHKATDSAASCRHKFALLITDGMDTFTCGGTGNEAQEDQYKRRRETVARTKALAEAGYKVFVLGFGATMPHFARNTLNWMAFYGATDNPLMANSGDPTAYAPGSYTSCLASTTDHHNFEGDGDHYYATGGDPGEISLSGYAFLASNSSEFTAALKQAMDIIREATYSFSVSSVASSRTQDENNIYEASFEPLDNDPFWPGHLKKYAINDDGSIGDVIWDAGYVLQAMGAGDRDIRTYKGGTLTAFTTANITQGDLAVANDTERNKVVGYIRGEPAYNLDNWKLGDIFRSNPITVATPSAFYEDVRDTNVVNAFGSFRSGNVRTSANEKRVVVVGANDGQIHAFRTSDGREIWSFIPPNFLPKLKNIAHSQHPTTASHQYFLDGPVMVSDVWLGTTGDGTSKSADDWKTLLIFGEGRGASSSLWSSSASCDSGLSPLYSTTYLYYCGYYAFDVTNPLVPAYKWRLGTTSTQGPYLGEPWSKIVTGRVKISGGERWVGFFGGGYNGADCAGGGECDSRGKGFFVVDLRTGEVLWSYTRADNGNMNYSLPSSPAIVDTDNDGFIDTAYIGDLGGSMWRFKFCSFFDDSTCTPANWTGGYLYGASTGEIRPIFAMPAVAKDGYGQIWVYWGTGDKTDPTAANAQEKFYAVKDSTGTNSYTISNLENITTGVYSELPSKNGWYINLAGQGEKILAEPTVFGGVVYYTSYTPANGNDPCNQAGTAKLWGINYMTGAALLSLSESMAPYGGGAQTSPTGATLYRNVSIGSGIPTAPILSFKPSGALPPDLYVTVSGGAGINVNTSRVSIDPPTLANRTNLLFWRDRRL